MFVGELFGGFMEEVKLGLEIKQTSKVIKQYVQRKIDENFKENDVHVTISEGMVLHYVHNHEDEVVTARVLIDQYGLSKATMSQILTSLLRKGLIHYEVYKPDGRMKRIVLSKKALRLESDINKSLADSDSFFKGAFTEKELETFADLLKKLRTFVSESK